MERDWLETVQLIGLDIFFFAIVVLIALNAFEPIFRSWVDSAHARRLTQSSDPAPDVADPQAGTPEASPRDVDALLDSTAPKWLADWLRSVPARDVSSPQDADPERPDDTGRRVA
jgi:hypothetical protein